jgi:ribonucleotide reductase beta subunit family protein with ferritin-like domain
MKTYFLLIIIAVITTLDTVAQKTPSKEQENVQQVIVKLFDGIAKQEMAQIKEQCTSNIMILESGEIWTLDTLIQKIGQKRPADFTRVNTIDFIDTQIEGNTAWTSYNNRADISVNGQQRFVTWLETAILFKEMNKWKVKVLHSTLVKHGTL